METKDLPITEEGSAKRKPLKSSSSQVEEEEEVLAQVKIEETEEIEELANFLANAEEESAENSNKLVVEKRDTNPESGKTSPAFPGLVMEKIQDVQADYLLAPIEPASTIGSTTEDEQ